VARPLSRTHLPEERLSEDIDLIVHPGSTRAGLAEILDRLFATGLRREVGRLHWNPALSHVPDHEPATVTGPDASSVQIQLPDHRGHRSGRAQRVRSVMSFRLPGAGHG
jgi:hypothetical protein